MFASDAERDEVVNRLAEAYSSGRLTAPEFEERSGRALAARTYGELDALLAGLERLDRRRPRSGRQVAVRLLRRVGFVVVALPLSVLILFGVLLFGFGSDGGDRFGGLILLVLFGPALVALYRWAWPHD